MKEISDYIKWIRSKVGKERIILNYAGGIVENEKGEILLQKRSPKEDLWGFPGGAMNIGESAEETAIREIKEETGYDVMVEELIGIYTKFLETCPNGDKSQTIVIIFKMRIVGGQEYIDEKESFELRFFDLDKVPYLYSSLHRIILEDIRAGITGVYR